MNRIDTMMKRQSFMCYRYSLGEIFDDEAMVLLTISTLNV